MCVAQWILLMPNYMINVMDPPPEARYGVFPSPQAFPCFCVQPLPSPALVPGGQLGFMSRERTHLACSPCVPQHSGFEIRPCVACMGTCSFLSLRMSILFWDLVTLLSPCHSSLGGAGVRGRVRELFSVCIIFLMDTMYFICPAPYDWILTLSSLLNVIHCWPCL